MSTLRKLIVAAIDIGITDSGFGYSSFHDYEKDPLKVMSVDWVTSDSRLPFKTPTCILFNKEKQFRYFGYEAEDKYADLALDEEHQEWYFFKNFKMSLCKKKEQLSRASTINTEDGKEMVALDVFSAAIKFLKGRILETIERTIIGLEERDIQWVLTIPAIWDDAAKQFMIEAADMAGISGDQILLVPEPVAGFVYSMNEKIPMSRKNCSSFYFETGTKCMVVIAENIGVEIAVYEVQHKGMLKKLFSSACNCDWGGNKVDDAFCSLLTDIFGDAVMKVFISEYEEDLRECLHYFEVNKMFIRPSSKKFTIPISIFLSQIFSKMNPECNFKTKISLLPKYKNELSFERGKLRINATLSKTFFDESCSKIIYHVQELFLYPTLKDVSSIILVGSYAESPMLEFALREAFQDPHRVVFVPENAAHAVLKGAVIYGHQLQQNLKF